MRAWRRVFEKVCWAEVCLEGVSEERRLREVPCCLCSFLDGEAWTDWDLVLSNAFLARFRPVRFSFLLIFLCAF